MGSIFDVWKDATRRPEFKGFMQDMSMRPLILEVHNSLAKFDGWFKDLEGTERLRKERVNDYDKGVDAVLKEAEALSNRLKDHPNARKEIKSFVDNITGESSDYNLCQVGIVAGTSHVRKTRDYWDREIVPAIKKHGLTPIWEVGRCHMHDLLTKLVALEESVDLVTRARAGRGGTINFEKANFESKARRLKEKLRACRLPGQQAAALKLTSILEEIERKVRWNEL